MQRNGCCLNLAYYYIPLGASKSAERGRYTFMIYLTEDIIKIFEYRSFYSVPCSYNFLTFDSIEIYLFFIAASFEWCGCELVGIGEQIFESGSKSKSSLVHFGTTSDVHCCSDLCPFPRGTGDTHTLVHGTIILCDCITDCILLDCPQSTNNCPF